MVATVLYHKNGVITEDRFQKMTPIQWVFHYMEVVKMSGEEKKLFVERLDDIWLGIQAFYLIVDRENGLKMMETLSKTKEDMKKNPRKPSKHSEDNSNNNQSNNEDDAPDLLSDEEKELWAFMQQQPEVIKETKQMQHVGRFMLPKKSAKQIMESQKAEIVDKLSNDEIPKLGF